MRFFEGLAEIITRCDPNRAKTLLLSFNRGFFAFKSVQANIINQTQTAAAVRQTQISIILAKLKAVFGSAGKHPVGFTCALRDQIINQNTDVCLVPAWCPRIFSTHTARGINARNQTLGCCFFITSSAIDLTGKKQTGYRFCLETEFKTARVKKIVLNSVSGAGDVSIFKAWDTTNEIHLHSDETSRQVTDSRQATGVAEGNVVHLHPERFDPSTAEGKGILAHEMAHVAQGQLPGTDYSTATVGEAEAEAERIGASYARSEQVEMNFACDGRYVVLSVKDFWGRLDRSTIMKYLEPNLSGKQAAIENKPGGAGLGLSLVMNSITQLVFNISPGRRTEIIALFYIRDGGRTFRTMGQNLHVFYA